MVVKHDHEVAEKRKNKCRYIHHRGEGGKRITYRINLQLVTYLKRVRSEQTQGSLVQMWMTTMSIKCTLIVSHWFHIMWNKFCYQQVHMQISGTI